MRNDNYVCFEHRHTARGHWAAVRCPVDGERMLWAGDRRRVPRRNDDAGWRRYRDYVVRLHHHLYYRVDIKVSKAQQLLRRWKK